MLSKLILLAQVAENSFFHARGTPFYKKIEEELLAELDELYEVNLDGEMVVSDCRKDLTNCA